MRSLALRTSERTAPRSRADAPARSARRSRAPARRWRRARRSASTRIGENGVDDAPRSAGRAILARGQREHVRARRSRPAGRARRATSCRKLDAGVRSRRGPLEQRDAPGGSASFGGPPAASSARGRSGRSTHSRASPAPSTSACAVPERAARDLRRRRRRRPARGSPARSARSRVTARSFCRTRPTTRAITSRNTTIEAAMITSRSKSPRRDLAHELDRRRDQRRGRQEARAAQP